MLMYSAFNSSSIFRSWTDSDGWIFFGFLGVLDLAVDLVGTYWSWFLLLRHWRVCTNILILLQILRHSIMCTLCVPPDIAARRLNILSTNRIRQAADWTLIALPFFTWRPH